MNRDTKQYCLMFCILLSTSMECFSQKVVSRPETLNEVLSRTFQECRGIPEEIAKDNALTELAKAQANMGRCQDAFLIAQEQVWYGYRSFSYISKRQADTGDLKEALITAGRIDDNPYWKQDTIIYIVELLVEKDYPQEALEQLKIARQIASKTKSVQSLGRIGLLYAKLNRMETSREVFSEAVRLKKAELPSSVMIEDEKSLYALQAEAGFLQEAIENASPPSLYLYQIADHLCSVGKLTEAEIVATNCDAGHHSHALISIAGVHRERHQKDQAILCLQKAEKLFDDIPLKDEGKDWLLALIKAIKQQQNKIELIAKAAEYMGKANMEEYKDLLVQARVNVYKLEDTYMQCLNMCHIANAYGNSNDTSAALSILVEAAKMDSKNSNSILGGIAFAQARFGDRDEARRNYLRYAASHEGTDVRLRGTVFSMVEVGLYKDAILKRLRGREK